MWRGRKNRHQWLRVRGPLAGIIVLLASSATILALGAAPAAMATVAPDEVAMTTLDDIVRADYGPAASQFDPALQKRLSVEALGQSWALYQQTFGTYQSHGDPESIQRGDLVVVNVPLQMERRPGQFRISVHPDGTIAQLLFLREGVPVSVIRPGTSRQR